MTDPVQPSAGTVTKTIIEARSVTKRYSLYSNPRHRFWSIILGPHLMKVPSADALADVSFSIKAGERVGVLGVNGSGKSTLLKLIAGTLAPTTGTISVNATIAPMVALGSAFNSELSGRENALQQLQAQGVESKRALDMLPEIDSFCELGSYFDRPLKTYSSGMAMRVGFASAVALRPDVLLIDEALAVGDSYFQAKCLEKIKRLLDQGSALLYVSHSADQVGGLCERGLLIDNGRLIGDGPAGEVGEQYKSLLAKKFLARAASTPSAGLSGSVSGDSEALPAADNATLEVSESFLNRTAALRVGNGAVMIVNVECFVNDMILTSKFQLGETIRVRVVFKYVNNVVNRLACGLAVVDSTGAQVLQFMSHDKGAWLEQGSANQLSALEFSFENVLAPGTYTINAGISTMKPSPDGTPGQQVADEVFDSRYVAAQFDSVSDFSNSNWGKVRVPYALRAVGAPSRTVSATGSEEHR